MQKIKARNILNKINKNIDDIINTPHHGYQFGKFIDKIVNLCTYGVILSLVGYMIARILRSFFQVFSAFFTEIANEGIMSFAAPEEVLHTVPITIILIKAYKLLLEYAKTQHVNIKFVLEIAITAPVVEIIFNFHGYNTPQLIFLGAFMVVASVIYLYFYPRIKEGNLDYTKKHTQH